MILVHNYRNAIPAPVLSTRHCSLLDEETPLVYHEHQSIEGQCAYVGTCLKFELSTDLWFRCEWTHMILEFCYCLLNVTNLSQEMTSSSNHTGVLSGAVHLNANMVYSSFRFLLQEAFYWALIAKWMEQL